MLRDVVLLCIGKAFLPIENFFLVGVKSKSLSNFAELDDHSVELGVELNVVNSKNLQGLVLPPTYKAEYQNNQGSANSHF
jgi:hypothetical protein